MSIEFLVAKPGALSAINFFPTIEAAQAALPYINEKYGPGHEAMTYEWFYQQKRAALLADPLQEITADQWTKALEVLPPLDWHTDEDGVEKFLLSEFYTGDFTHQYASFEGRYFSRLVSAHDLPTYITRQQIEAMPRAALETQSA